MNASIHTVRRRVIRVTLNGLFEDCNRGFAFGFRQSPEQRVCLTYHLPGAEVLRGVTLRADAFSLQQLWFDRSNHLLRDRVLQGKNVGQVAVVSIGPDVIASLGIDQL